VNLVDRDAIIDKLVYTASNPVADHLVDRVHHWPGVNGLAGLLAARPLRATRPLHFFRPDGSMPMPSSSRSPCPPSSDLPLPYDRSCATAYAPSRSNARPSEHALVAACSVASPCSPAVVRGSGDRGVRRNLRPRIATRSQWPRIETLLRSRAFAADYARARDQWRNGLPAVFPAGTYWLRRFSSVLVLEA
jgi:hypothetical protein